MTRPRVSCGTTLAMHWPAARRRARQLQRVVSTMPTHARVLLPLRALSCFGVRRGAHFILTIAPAPWSWLLPFEKRFALSLPCARAAPSPIVLTNSVKLRARRRHFMVTMTRPRVGCATLAMPWPAARRRARQLQRVVSTMPIHAGVPLPVRASSCFGVRRGAHFKLAELPAAWSWLLPFEKRFDLSLPCARAAPSPIVLTSSVKLRALPPEASEVARD